ncbi:MAG: sigma-54-dependent Fis family transcriptional regulator [Saprospirales bacterium]|jgi:two-component system nitrogen regulation response regulator NtrX|nr:sigma-54-dependent Fis family transcriptional regulator [Saprospirales bacterium]
MAKVLIVDDEASIRKAFRNILEFESYQVDEAADGLEALAKVKQWKPDLLIMDIKMPKMDGMETLEKLRTLSPDTPVIMISGHANIDTAVESVRKGAFDFISKPPDLNRVLITVRNALDRSSLVTETKTLKRQVSKGKVQEIIGESEAIRQIMSTIERVAPSDARVLVTGSNGTGKELVARWIHEYSNRKDAPLIEVNCAAIPSELIESELFGHEKGAFTSAMKQHIGKFEQANGGTLFLDEIGDMSLSAQAKVLRALQENRISRVGGDKDIQVDVRVIAATNKDLRAEIEKGSFREDLFHRLSVIPIRVPSLNERRDDIPLLIRYFIEIVSGEMGLPVKKIEETAVATLQQLNWTGNIRELRNVVERLMILSGDKITLKDVELYVLPTAASDRLPLARLFEQFGNLEDLQRYIAEEYKNFTRG